jgi:PAS domain S-box-containing protein
VPLLEGAWPQKVNGRPEDAIKGLALGPLQQVLLHDAADRSPALIFVADSEMRYLAVNTTACEVLGYTRDELLALRVTDIAVSVEAESLYQEMLTVRSQQGDVELRTKDGRLLPFVYEASEVTVGKAQHWVAVGFVNLRLFDRVQQLETALLSRVVIEQAKGVLAGRYEIGLEEAFETIRSAARSNNLVLRELCARVIDEPSTPAEIERRLQHLPRHEARSRGSDRSSTV